MRITLRALRTRAAAVGIATAIVVTPTVFLATEAHATVSGTICYGALPSQAHDTLDLIKTNGPFPYSQDGVVFQNREGVLPSQSTGYYHEYTVKTPGSPTRGTRRIITGEKTAEDYYTADHYVTFKQVDFTC
ncbi:ribonuclease domain-containing protein [Streptomyces sp. NBC_00388]|uniref:ribonuclease domain-containing protein n=1 Tax=Streptomyces sp. NBC_00388 TaxID=2975735 RepID=UPI002E1BABE2